MMFNKLFPYFSVENKNLNENSTFNFSNTQKNDTNKESIKFNDVLKDIRDKSKNREVKVPIKLKDAVDKIENIEKDIKGLETNKSNGELPLEEITALLEKIKLLIANIKIDDKKNSLSSNKDGIDYSTLINQILIQISELLKNTQTDHSALLKKLDVFSKKLDEIKEVSDKGKNIIVSIKVEENKNEINQNLQNKQNDKDPVITEEKVKVIDKRSDSEKKGQNLSFVQNDVKNKMSVSKETLKEEKTVQPSNSGNAKIDRKIESILQKTNEKDNNDIVKQKSDFFQNVKQGDQAAVKIYAGYTNSISKVNLEAMMQNITGKAVITLRDGKSELKMNLIPPELGRMNMKFNLEDGQLIGKIVVSTPEAKMLFDQNLGDLQRALQQAGINLAHLDVSLGQQGTNEHGSDSNAFSAGSNGIDEVIIENSDSDKVFIGGKLFESSINYLA